MSFEVGDSRETLAYFLSICESLSFNLLTQQDSARLWTKGSASLCRYCRATIRASPIPARQSRQTTL